MHRRQTWLLLPESCFTVSLAVVVDFCLLSLIVHNIKSTLIKSDCNAPANPHISDLLRCCSNKKAQDPFCKKFLNDLAKIKMVNQRTNCLSIKIVCIGKTFTCRCPSRSSSYSSAFNAAHLSSLNITYYRVLRSHALCIWVTFKGEIVGICLNVKLVLVQLDLSLHWTLKRRNTGK